MSPRYNSYGEEQEPTAADLLRWKQEDDREFGFNGYDEDYIDPPPPPTRKHIFGECTKERCTTCATR